MKKIYQQPILEIIHVQVNAGILNSFSMAVNQENGDAEGEAYARRNYGIFDDEDTSGSMWDE